MTTGFSPSAQSLVGVHIFKELAAEHREAIARRCRSLQIDAGQEVVNDQDEGRDVYFIVIGRVRVHIYTISGKEITFRDLGAGEMFGEIAAIDGESRSASIVAIEDSLLLRMGDVEFREILAAHHSVAIGMMTHMAGLIRVLSERVFEFSALAVKHRIHAELLRLACEHPDGENGALLDPAPTHAELASRISTHREAVTRELNHLHKLGLVQRDGNTLLVTDMATLQRMVEMVKG